MIGKPIGMNKKARIIAALALTALLSSGAAIGQKAQLTPKETGPISESESAYPYRLFETTNNWTFILLDTATGRAWQVNYSLDDTPRMRLVINGASLLPEGAPPKNGRFTLYSTSNMYNFLLLDRDDSRIWQLQWSLESKNRGIVRSIPLDR
jgi:hypothetical protein